jgi:hypothetical protein
VEDVTAPSSYKLYYFKLKMKTERISEKHPYSQILTKSSCRNKIRHVILCSRFLFTPQSVALAKCKAYIRPHISNALFVALMFCRYLTCELIRVKRYFVGIGNLAVAWNHDSSLGNMTSIIYSPLTVRKSLNSQALLGLEAVTFSSCTDADLHG